MVGYAFCATGFAFAGVAFFMDEAIGQEVGTEITGVILLAVRIVLARSKAVVDIPVSGRPVKVRAISKISTPKSLATLEMHAAQMRQILGLMAPAFTPEGARHV